MAHSHRLAWLLAVIAVPALPGSASAGRTHYGWLYGTEVNPERAVEVETWILQENGKDEVDETLVWWGPVVGLTEHLELAIPLEMAYEDDGTSAGTNLVRFGGELRYRFNSPDPLQAGPVTALARAGVKRLVQARSGIRGEGDLVLAFERGRFHASVDGGVVVKHVDEEDEVELRPAAGFSIETVSEIRIGAEGYAELAVEGSDAHDWLAIGPTVSVTRGRFWAVGTVPIGVFGIDSAPRINFAIAF